MQIYAPYGTDYFFTMSQFDLVVTLDDGRNYEFLLPEGTYVLGHEDGCEIRLQSDTISGRHSCLTLESEQFLIEDLGSDSGTKVGESSVTAKQSFIYPAKLQLGSICLILSRQALPGGQTAAATATMTETQTDSVQRIMFSKPERASLRIANYQVGKEIAKGGMGSILEAEDSSLRRVVAMKVLLP